MLKAAVKFIRLKILATCSLIILLGSLSAGSVSYKTLLAVIIFAIIYIHAASLNDYTDREIDEINLPEAKDRPLVTRLISEKALWKIHYAAGTIAFILSIFYGIPAIIMTVVVLMFNYAYSLKPFRITDRGILAQFTLPFVYVIYSFYLGYWSLATTAVFPLLLVTGLYSGFIARLFLKDFRDIKGDSEFGKRTFLIRYGIKRTCFASWLFGFIALVSLVLATNLFPATLIVLIPGHIATIFLLIRLSHTSRIKSQMKLIAGLAKIGNISVLAVLLYYLNHSSLWVLL